MTDFNIPGPSVRIVSEKLFQGIIVDDSTTPGCYGKEILKL